ncbi:MAG: SusC/RagA family TonB-linked outer membrane protein [Paludibacter sp.]|nr:SusC/RagA family TonB-linked outer membrane protein [Paludibacter sp.]
MRKLTFLLTCLFLVGLGLVNAQSKSISGKVISSEDGQPIIGATILVKGTTVGTITNVEGLFKISLPGNAKDLVVSYVGMKTVQLEAKNNMVITLVTEDNVFNEVVVTAMGISRQKKALGYATQDLSGEDLSTVKSDNFLNSLSGKISGVQIKKNTNMGGSTNIVMRGSKSLTGNNQVLFVVDGVPVSNDNFNYVSNTSPSGSQSTGSVGYDYGNAASDINPDDIESVNVLKGAAATALYGSRAANGVVMITTKKGTSKKAKGFGISINTGVTVGVIDKSTFPTYQNKYGAGYGAFYGNDGSSYFNSNDINGDGLSDITGTPTATDYPIVPTTEDASFGAAFDANKLVYQWNSLYPGLPNYKKATPWVAAKNGPITFFENPVTYNTTVAIDNASDKGSYRLSYTNYNQKGLMPNSDLKKNTFGLNGVWNVTDKLTASATGNFSRQEATGRNSTGYNDNILTSMRQWMETNVDYQEQKAAYLSTGSNISWNPALTSITDLKPIYWDNPYWTRYKNYETDARDRYMGNFTLNYKIADWVSVMGRVSMDSYNQLMEERRAVGSVPTTFGLDRTDQESGYYRKNINFSEFNYDLMANFKKTITEDLNFSGILGMNLRRNFNNTIAASTNGGLVSPGIYSLQNSAGPLPFPVETAEKTGVDGFYGSVSFGYKDLLFLDGTYRVDHSSTLPVGNSTYPYYSVAGSFLFSTLVKQDWLDLGKVRLSYAQVGNSAPFDNLKDTYSVITPFNTSLYGVSSTKKNAQLRPERTASLEGGLEMYFLKRRVGVDLALYKTNTTNQIVPVKLSQTTGYNQEIINAGDIENKGVELSLMLTPVLTKDFKWDVKINWSKNSNKVVSLINGVDNYQLGAFGGGVTLNARVGEPYGALMGTDYTYTDKGQKIISATTGKPVKTATADHVIGNVTPDWNGGFQSTMTYKNWAFSFLIDMQKGGDIYSLDMYYGLSTGLYAETAGNNELGNPLRNPIVYNDPTVGLASGYASTTGGYINQGVNVSATGVITPNKTRVNTTSYAGLGYKAEPNKAFIYDAGYIKLREISLSYSIPAKLLKNAFIQGLTFSAVASNPLIISKGLPYADPESGLGSGNVQGYSIGSLPSTRDFGFNIKLNF